MSFLAISGIAGYEQHMVSDDRVQERIQRHLCLWRLDGLWLQAGQGQ